MSNSLRGEVEVDLIGRTWTMRPTLQAIRETEDRTGRGIAGTVRRFAQGEFGIDDVSALLHSGIRAGHDEAPSFAEVQGAVFEEGFDRLATAAAMLLRNALAPMPGEAGEPGKEAGGVPGKKPAAARGKKK
jgi:hypothetical protein